MALTTHLGDLVEGIRARLLVGHPDGVSELVHQGGHAKTPGSVDGSFEATARHRRLDHEALFSSMAVTSRNRGIAPYNFFFPLLQLESSLS